MDSDVIIYAMQLAVESNIRTINYIKAILNNWSKAGVKTLVQAKEENMSFKNKISTTNKAETLEEETARLKKEWGLSDED